VKVAYQGAPGAFGHQACLIFLPGYEPEPRATFEEVAASVARGETELGILPVENSRAGPVEGVAAIIAAEGIRIVSEHLLPVRMHLAVLPGVKLEEVATVVSHPVALRQCAASIAGLGLATEVAPNTAVAARDLGDRTKAVLASDAAADAYGLSILQHDLQDDPNNATRFVVLARA
jgi:prephenate dehydratase